MPSADLRPHSQPLRGRAYDLLIQDGTVVSMFTGETFPADVAIRGDTIAALLPPGIVAPGQAADVLDATGLTVAPGYVDAHMHVESSLRHPGRLRLADPPARHDHRAGRLPRDRQRRRQAGPALDDRGWPGAPPRPSSTACPRACRPCSASRRPAPS